MDQTKKVKVLFTKIPANGWFDIAPNVRIFNEKGNTARLRIVTYIIEDNPLETEGVKNHDKK